MAVTVALRLPFLNHPPSPDEAGFLLVGGQWHAGGMSLYGNYWVDRPPLLIGLFQLSSALGGLPALRLLGCVAVALIVICSAATAGMIAGRLAARWTAVVAAALCTTPLLGTVAVNGELLAGPFIAGSIVATVAALRAVDNRKAGQLALAAGAIAMCALLVKQNFADAFVFGLVATAFAWRRGDISGRRLSRIFVSAGAGATIAVYAVAFMASLRGTSWGGVFNAMYPFRFAADKVMAEAGRQHAAGRLDLLLFATVVSGISLLIGMIVWAGTSRRLHGPAVIALCATLVFAMLSIGLGGNYWIHYLVELIVPVSILTGILIARRQPFMVPLVAALAVASSVAWGAWHVAVPTSTGTTVGRSIAASAKPSDTIVTAYGHADVDQTSGLSSPYAYLWSLPIKTLDPQLNELNLVLTGPQAPTWFVTWNKIPSWGLESNAVQAVVDREYRPVGKVCGRTIYLRDGVRRPAVRAQSPCPGAPVFNAALTKELP